MNVLCLLKAHRCKLLCQLEHLPVQLVLLTLHLLLLSAPVLTILLILSLLFQVLSIRPPAVVFAAFHPLHPLRQEPTVIVIHVERPPR